MKLTPDMLIYYHTISPLIKQDVAEPDVELHWEEKRLVQVELSLGFHQGR